jgi:peptide/nickel transport system substrate-binding protein
MRFTNRFGRGVAAVGLTVALAGGLAACGSSSSSGPAVPGAVTVAEAPSTPPNYIFPFMGLQFFSVSNINQFQFLMYRPLYWFGTSSSAALVPSLSLAQNPEYSNGNKTVTVNLKNYKWSNGETVTSQDVVFWMNMMHADKDQWAAYSAGAMPDDVTSVTANSPTQVTFQLTGSVNPNWFTYNELSQITPMPKAWDITAVGGAPGSGGCFAAAYGTADTACNNVFTFLSKQAGFDPANPKGANNALATYATNPIWQIVDGPYRLSKFDASGNVTMVANKSYSGTPKPSIQTVIQVPFTTDNAEFNALVAGKVDVGYLPSQDITGNAPNSSTAGPNNPRLGNYNLLTGYPWSINYFPYNFNSTGDGGNAGAIFSQLYVRQAMQELVDQNLYIQKIDKGYGVPTWGPVPAYPKNSFSSLTQNPYPYSPSSAINLLKSHGWTVNPNGISVCASPGTGANQCGANIPAGAKLDFTLDYSSGSANLDQLMSAEKSAWAQAGINITLKSESFNTVIGNAVPCSGSSCTWELANWGAGWIFAPDYYPSGEVLFQTGAGSNSGSYSSKTADDLINQTTTGNASLAAYEKYLAQQLPVVYQPNPTAVGEVNKGLKGFEPNVLQQLNPELWSW